MTPKGTLSDDNQPDDRSASGWYNTKVSATEHGVSSRVSSCFSSELTGMLLPLRDDRAVSRWCADHGHVYMVVSYYDCVSG